MAVSTSNSEVRTAITEYLRSKNVAPTQAWLRDFMPSIRINTPIVALQKTALFRILSTDITASVLPPSQNLFPRDVASPEVKERKLSGPITVQILDIEDIGRSHWSQVEEIEAYERGEMTKGREIIRVVADETNSDPNHTSAANASHGPHKLLLQDAKGTKVYAFETQSVAGIGPHTSIGAKLVLRDVMVARGLVMVEPKSVELLGGKVEAWDKKWKSEKKEELKRKAGMGQNDGG